MSLNYKLLMNITKKLFLSIVYLLLAFPLQAQIKPTAMLLPIYFVDLDKKGLQGSLNNHVQTELSAYYELKSEKEIEQARDAAIDKLSSENCTEEACVKVMGEMLEVEYTFSLEVIDTGEGWDLTAVRQNLDGVSSRRNELCKNCSLSKTRKSLSGMLTLLRPGEMLIQRGKASLRLEATPQAQVFLDGRDQGKTPLDLSVDARKPLEILMVAEGYNDFTEEFILEPGEKRKKHVKLVRKRGRVRIVSDPSGAKIFINGKPEIGADGKTKQTPADLRLVYGEHQLTLNLENYQPLSETILIEERDHGTKTFNLEPVPGSLVVRVPAKNKSARVYVDDYSVGSMDGGIAKSFEVPANKTLLVYVKDGLAISTEETVRLAPAGTKTITFETLKIPEKPGVRLGLGYELDSFSLTMAGSGSQEIKASYSVSGFALHGLIYPGRNLIHLSYLSGSGIISEPATPFILVSGTNSYTITGTKAEVIRLLYNSEWAPGWNYAYGWEQIIAYFIADQGDRKITVRSPLVEGSYEFSNLFYLLSDNNMSLETRARYSLISGFGYTVGIYGTFR